MKISSNFPNEYKTNTSVKNTNRENKATIKDDKPNMISDQKINKATYDKPKLGNNNKILKLKAESEQAYSHLRQLVMDLLKRQGYSVDQISNPQLKDVEVDDIARQEASALVGPKGILGAEKTSERIVQFAIALSGGDKNKLQELKSAIDKGFKEAEKILGELPPVSKETYNLIMDKLDRWAEE